jgi:hypothetical protein
MAGQDPVVCPSASQTSDNDLDDEHPMDEDERLDFADQEPLPSPTVHSNRTRYCILYHSLYLTLSLQQR